MLKPQSQRCTRSESNFLWNRRNTSVVLKQEQGKNILTGGVSISSQPTELGLVDEYRFVVQPIVAGKGDGC
jgi:hypothetical protein